MHNLTFYFYIIKTYINIIIDYNTLIICYNKYIYKTYMRNYEKKIIIYIIKPNNKQ